MSLGPLALLGAIVLIASSNSSGSSSSSSSKPKLPKLPAKLGAPPANVAKLPVTPGKVPKVPINYVVPGSPPAGAVAPGTPPNIIDVSSPKVVQTSAAELKAMQKRVADRIAAEKNRASAAAKEVVKNPAKVPPLPSVKASPVLEPNRGSSPAGYDPVKARARARAIAAHLAKKGPSSYSHAELQTWQRQAGLTADGKYGGSSRGALIYFGVKDPPRPFFAPVATLPYVPPEQRK